MESICGGFRDGRGGYGYCARSAGFWCRRLGSVEKIQFAVYSTCGDGWDIQTGSERFCGRGFESACEERSRGNKRSRSLCCETSRSKELIVFERKISPRIPALLEMRYTASQLCNVVVVCKNRGGERKIVKSRRANQLVARAHQAREMGQVARRRKGLVYFTTAILGERDSYLEMRKV